MNLVCLLCIHEKLYSVFGISYELYNDFDTMERSMLNGGNKLSYPRRETRSLRRPSLGSVNITTKTVCVHD